MLTFSLIVATLGRATDLEYLFKSVAAQGYPQMECIVIDQNTDDRVERIVERWQPAIPLRRVTSAPGLSRARNVGLELATGDIMAFPDDDCWYSESLLVDVAAWFETHPEFSILTVGAQDHDGVPSGNRWVQNRCEIRPSNAFRTTFSSTIFVRRTATTSQARFDEALGVGSGTPFQCGEETDYVLNLLHNGARGYFDRTWHIGHPKRDMLSGQIDRRRATGYGRGMGHVLRKQAEPLLAVGFVAYDLLRAMLANAKGNFMAGDLCLRHGWGIASGYVASIPQPLSATPLSASSQLAKVLPFAQKLIAPPQERTEG